MSIKVILIDESQIFRLGLKKTLIDDDMLVIGEAADGASAQRLIRQKQPDIVLLNAHLPDAMSITICDFIASHFPGIGTLFFLNQEDLSLLNRLIRTSAKGFIAKNSVYQIGEAIRTVQSGKTYLQPDMGLEFIRFRDRYPLAATDRLTDREYQILLMLARGKTSQEIATQAHLSVRTVFNLKSSGFKKLSIEKLEQLQEFIFK